MLLTVLLPVLLAGFSMEASGVYIQFDPKPHRAPSRPHHDVHVPSSCCLRDLQLHIFIQMTGKQPYGNSLIWEWLNKTDELLSTFCKKNKNVADICIVTDHLKGHGSPVCEMFSQNKWWRGSEDRAGILDVCLVDRQLGKITCEQLDAPARDPAEHGDSATGQFATVSVMHTMMRCFSNTSDKIFSIFKSHFVYDICDNIHSNIGTLVTHVLEFCFATLQIIMLLFIYFVLLANYILFATICICRYVALCYKKIHPPIYWVFETVVVFAFLVLLLTIIYRLIQMVATIVLNILIFLLQQVIHTIIHYSLVAILSCVCIVIKPAIFLLVAFFKVIKLLAVDILFVIIKTVIENESVSTIVLNINIYALYIVVLLAIAMCVKSIIRNTDIDWARTENFSTLFERVYINWTRTKNTVTSLRWRYIDGARVTEFTSLTWRYIDWAIKEDFTSLTRRYIDWERVENLISFTWRYIEWARMKTLFTQTIRWFTNISFRSDKTVQCVVCFDLTAPVRLLPCGHSSICSSCAMIVRQIFGRCPLCRRVIDDIAS